jgi:hypothetical protein
MDAERDVDVTCILHKPLLTVGEFPMSLLTFHTKIREFYEVTMKQMIGCFLTMEQKNERRVPTLHSLYRSTQKDNTLDQPYPSPDPPLLSPSSHPAPSPNSSMTAGSPSPAIAQAQPP